MPYARWAEKDRAGPVPDDPRDQLAATLVTLRTRVDQHFEAAVQRSPEQIACREGCSQCCHRRFGVFEVEASLLRERLATIASDDPGLRARIHAQVDDPAHAGICPLLVDDRCVAYEVRPLICRAHGLPTAVQEGDALHVDVCSLNFTDAEPPSASVLLLERVNQPLAVIAEMWAPGQPRVPLAELARLPSRGSG